MGEQRSLIIIEVSAVGREVPAVEEDRRCDFGHVLGQLIGEVTCPEGVNLIVIGINTVTQVVLVNIVTIDIGRRQVEIEVAIFV